LDKFRTPGLNYIVECADWFNKRQVILPSNLHHNPALCWTRASLVDRRN